MKILHIFLLLLLPMCLYVCQAKKASQHQIVRLDKFECAVNPSFIDFHNCSILEPEKSRMSAEVNFIRVLDQFNSSFTLYLPRGPSNEYHKIISMNFNVCEFYKNSKQNKFVTIAYNSMMKDSNSPRKCPQQKGLYYFRNIDIGENLPPFLPNNFFKVDFNFLVSHLSVMNISLHGQVSEAPRPKGK